MVEEKYGMKKTRQNRRKLIKKRLRKRSLFSGCFKFTLVVLLLVPLTCVRFHSKATTVKVNGRTRKLPDPPAKGPTGFAVKEHMYSLLTKLTLEEWEDCGIHILTSPQKKSSNKLSMDNDDSFRDSFLAELSSKIIPYEIHSIPTKGKGPKSSSGSPYRNSGGFGRSRECSLFFVEVQESSSLPKIVTMITKMIHPKPLHSVKVLLLNFEVIPSTSIASKASLLQSKALETIPYKMEMVGALSHAYELRAILFAFCSYCPENKAEGRKASGYQLIGGYSKSSGYWKYNKLFPEPPMNFHKKAATVSTSVVGETPPDKQTSGRPAPPLSDKILHFAKKLQETKVSVNQKFNEIGIPAPKRPRLLAVLALLDNFNLTLDVPGSKSLNYKSIIDASEMDSLLSKEFISFAMTYRVQKQNPLYKAMQSSMCFSGQKGLFLFRELDAPAEEFVTQGIAVSVLQAVLSCAISGVFLMLTMKYDLLSKFRLPRQADRDNWRHFSRRFTWHRFMNLFGYSLAHYFQQVNFPRLNLTRFAPSGTVWVTCFALYGIFVFWGLKLVPLVDIVLNPKPVFDIKTIDDVARLVAGQIHLRKKVEVYSMIDPDYWKGFLDILEDKERKDLLRNLFDKTIFTLNAYECLGNALDENPYTFSICMGYFNIETRGKSSIDFQIGKPLQVRYIGDRKYFSVGFATQFPYFEQFNKAIFGLVESGLINHWRKEYLSVDVGPQNKLNQPVQPGRVTVELFQMAMIIPLCLLVLATVVFILEVIIGYGLIPKAWKKLRFAVLMLATIVGTVLAFSWSLIRSILLKLKPKSNHTHQVTQVKQKLTLDEIEKLSEKEFRNNPALQFHR